MRTTIAFLGLFLALLPVQAFADCKANIKITNKHASGGSATLKELTYGCSDIIFSSKSLSGKLAYGKSTIVKDVVLDAIFDCNVLCKKYEFRVFYTYYNATGFPVGTAGRTNTPVTKSGQVVTVNLE